MSNTDNYYSPWVKKANQSGAQKFVEERGRRDDITIICAQIRLTGEIEPPQKTMSNGE